MGFPEITLIYITYGGGKFVNEILKILLIYINIYIPI